MSTRIKPNIQKLNSLEEVDDSLREIGECESELAKIDMAADKKIAAIKAKAADDGEPLRKRIAELSGMIGAYAQYNRADLFQDKKTIELKFGIFGFRKSTSISVRKTTVELLKKLGLTAYIRIKEEPNKDLMSELDDERLKEVDAVRKVKDDFFCETKKEEVNGELVRNQVA